MKILVCISKVPDTTSKINFVDNDTKFDENGVQYVVNPYDEWYALVRALELVEAQGGSVNPDQNHGFQGTLKEEGNPSR